MADLIRHLNDLLALDLDAVEAYESAITRIDAVFLREKLREFQQDHQRHIRDLTECVMRFGGKPRHRPDVKGFFIKGFTAVTSMTGDEGALNAMKGNEQLTTRTYKRALADSWPADVRELIEKNYADEVRHLAWIEQTLRTRAWEGAAKTM
jgi:uncharacterized protein (TIGR02284 family)